MNVYAPWLVAGYLRNNLYVVRSTQRRSRSIDPTRTVRKRRRWPSGPSGGIRSRGLVRQKINRQLVAVFGGDDRSQRQSRARAQRPRRHMGVGRGAVH